MTREDIIRMARRAIRLSVNDASQISFDVEETILDKYEFLYWFAKEVAAAEREKFTIHAAALVRDARQDAIERERDRRTFEIAESYRCGWDSGVKAERDECARACIEVGATKANSDDGLDIADLCAATITARGTK